MQKIVGRTLALLVWPFAFALDLLLVGISHPMLDRLDVWQCGVIGHGKSYEQSGSCILCGYERPPTPNIN